MKHLHAFLLLGLLCLSTAAMSAPTTVRLSTGATLTIYQADASKANGCGIVVCPGGGYSYLAGDTEGAGWADYMNSRGFTIAVLAYRLPHGQHQVPLTDGRAAMQYLRDNAASLMLYANRIGVMGFSAGGHLASTIATHTEGDERPAFQILFYPVITMEAGKTHQGSIDNLLGTNPSADLVALYSNQFHVSADTPPAYITYSDNDGTVPPLTNGKVYYDALVAAGVPATLKTYPTGGHGWGTGDKLGATYKAEMQQHFGNWLTTLEQLLPPTEVYDDVTSITIEAGAEEVEAINPRMYPNLTTIVVNSPAVAAKNYTAAKNLTAAFGTEVTSYVFGEGITTLGRYLLTGSTGVTSVSLPTTLTAIGMQAFAKCTSLTAIDLPAGLDEIGISAFAQSGLHSIVIPSARVVGTSAFVSCTELESIELPANLDTIGTNALKGCKALTAIRCRSAVPARAAKAFADKTVFGQATVTVPAGSLEAYQTHPVWSQFANIVEESGEDAVSTPRISTSADNVLYSLDGRRAAARQRGLLVRRGQKLVR